MSTIEELINKIDDYEKTIHAIVGFMHLCRYKDNQIRNDVKIFQGRKLIPHAYPEKNVTPDFGILMPSNIGIIGEVKKSFPREKEYWMKTFIQLMSYDDDLSHWPTNSGKVISHDIVLLVHQSRAVEVIEYYNQNNPKSILFKKPFIIIQFNRSDERVPYYYFEIRYGKLTEQSIHELLQYGNNIPMEVLSGEYSVIKIYDADPPIPYLTDLVWKHVILAEANEDEKFSTLRRNQKLDIIKDIDDIVEKLYKEFSFYYLCDDADNQPKYPKKSWVLRTCNHLVKTKEAEWVIPNKKIKVFFTKKYNDTLAHFIDTYSKYEEDHQIELFKDSEM